MRFGGTYQNTLRVMMTRSVAPPGKCVLYTDRPGTHLLEMPHSRGKFTYGLTDSTVKKRLPPLSDILPLMLTLRATLSRTAGGRGDLSLLGNRT